MLDDRASTPLLATWADVDPARHPFDPVEMSVAVRTLVPPPPPRPTFRDGGWVGESEAFAWVDSVSVPLSDRYGQWAYRWYWGPVEREQLGFVTDRIPAPAEAPAFVADSLLAWRRWLESLAERFYWILPSLDAAQTGDAADVVVAWEAAITQLMTFALAPVVDNDGWQGNSQLTLQWFDRRRHTVGTGAGAGLRCAQAFRLVAVRPRWRSARSPNGSPETRSAPPGSCRPAESTTGPTRGHMVGRPGGRRTPAGGAGSPSDRGHSA